MIEINELKTFFWKGKSYQFKKVLEFCVNPIFYKNNSIKKCGEESGFYEYDIIDFRIPKRGENLIYGGTVKGVGSVCSGQSKDKAWIVMLTKKYTKKEIYNAL